MNNEKFFTDVVKDVIGNDPVLDQFDVYYDASFYGTMQDDYVTGSILIESKNARNQKILTVGERGRAFSKYYANSEPALDSTFGSAAVTANPSLAFRKVPNSSRVSTTAYRLTQCYDARERYYDSCLPDLKKCFAASSTQLWTTESENKTAFSPVGNMVSSSVGYVLFNSYTTDRSSLGFDSDPTVNNDWTWSYPYENKFEPQTRLVKVNSALGLTDVSLVSSFGMFLSDIEDFLEVFNLRTSKPKNLTGFFPILPGFLNSALLPQGARNSLRSRFVPPDEEYDLLFQTNRIPASYAATGLDGNFGISMLIPGDINLSEKTSHDWMASYSGITVPGPEYVTGTMTLDDTVKFLFGFGDLNNMTYGYRLFNSSSSTQGYFQDFERSNPADSRNYFADDVPTSTSTYLTINWSNSPTTKPWQYVVKDGATGSPLYYNYISASSPGVGMYWLDATATNDWVLLSDTSTTYGGAMGSTDYSLCCVDITSSVPWSLKYKRGVVAATDTTFITYFSGIPGYPSHELPFGPLQVVVPLDIITGSGPTIKYDILSEYNSQIDGVYDSNFGKTVAGTDLFPFPPGEWRLNFSFAHNPLGGGPAASTPDIAAIKDVEITVFGPACFPPDASGGMIGGNNYPDFRMTTCDTRFNPVLKSFGATNFQVTASADIYKSFVVGVSPVIRGWKYGLFNGFPTHSKAVFRRNSYGQFRDMLEQRQYTKFINVGNSPSDNTAIKSGEYSTVDNRTTTSGDSEQPNLAAVEVNFVRQRYRKDDKGIGYIYNEKIVPELTYSQNLSTEVTSSVPYFDGVAKHRQESDLRLITDATTSTLQVGSNGLTVS
jgi:hypothetical protein